MAPLVSQDLDCNADLRHLASEGVRRRAERPTGTPGDPWLSEWSSAGSVSGRTVSLFGILEPAGRRGLLLRECLGRGRDGQSPGEQGCGPTGVMTMALTLGIDVAVRAEHQATLARDGATVWRGRKFWNGCGRTWTCPIRQS
ncbi:conserved hypothetical protein [Rhodococcus jostii RHA1]|uniref:Uncharacterized protein n=1 Tax=Rhodococcus jostii (strain RHA1) TaxID=101510 RepID=Q0S0E9_RHOJR|nr:conserved hypothetical protein [Rhodococcus jostii RHA1]